MNIAEEVKRNRLKQNLTQEQLAEALNVSRSTVSSWEVGRNYPDLETIVAISYLFEISVDELLKGDKKMLVQITEDTKVRKKQTNKIILLCIGLFISIIIIIFMCIILFEIRSSKSFEPLRKENKWKISQKVLMLTTCIKNIKIKTS